MLAPKNGHVPPTVTPTMTKQHTEISSEEQHLADMSTPSSVTAAVKKSSNKSILKSTATSKIEKETIATDMAKSEIICDLSPNSSKKVKGIDVQDTKKKTKSKKAKKSEGGEPESTTVFPQDKKKVQCKLCSKPVYKMEEIKAEKNVYHKNCFRCHGCNKQLKVDNYESHEGHPYCMIHFKLLFAPKVVEETEPKKPCKPEMIIRENEPKDLPPDVVRASDMPDLGLEDLHQLNVRSRFQVFEKGLQQVKEPLPANEEHIVRRGSTILSKVAKLQAHGLSGSIDGENISADVQSSSEHEDSSSCIEDDEEDVDLVRSKKRTRERPVGIGKAMNDIKTKFEKGPLVTKDERREERKQEIQNIRSRLFMGKQAKFKEMYQQAVADSEQAIISTDKKPEVEIDGVTRSIKERFEKGEVFRSDHIHESEVKPDDIRAESSEVSEKFKFFETYRPTQGKQKEFRITPPREGVVKMPSPDRSDQDQTFQDNEESNLLEKSRTTAKMLDRFRKMEKNKNKKKENGPRPLKCFTPPPDGGRRLLQSADSEQGSDDDSEDSNGGARDLDKDAMKREKLLADDAALKEAQNAARAKELRAKFEKWETGEIQREMQENRMDICSQADETNIESTKSIRERFENLKTAEARTLKRPRHQINRFV